MSQKVTIRKANKNDAEGKGYVHYKSWIETYSGLLPEEKMTTVTLENSILKAREHFENTFIAEVDGKIVGFTTYCKARDEDIVGAGEIMAIYVLKEYHRMGLGKKLIRKCYEELHEYSKIILWVLKDNLNSIKFYKNEGFEADGETKFFYDRELIRMIKIIK